MSKGSLYHHFPNGKEELLIAYLDSLNDAITIDIEGIFNENPTTEEATSAMIEGAMMHSLTQKAIHPLRVVSRELLKIIKANK
ncbi:TetR/AcrR family transcriptional regulator [Lysinibacillus composti]|uniref:TetR/AcrR family transcriptional regulator n=1 Tax=Lysinibacillus composti TaxID=720633 RepID=UPI001F01E620|nr:TetR/AcrR family transcriptional regulator [Lysinibacillus composti]